MVIRHCKHPAAGTITFPYPGVGGVPGRRDRLPHPDQRGAAITKIGTDTLVTSPATEVALRFDESERSAFLAGPLTANSTYNGQFTA